MPVLLMEPVSYGKRRRHSEIIMGPKRQPQPTLEDVKQRLKTIRNYSLAHLDMLVTGLSASLAAYPEMEITFARDTGQVIETIGGITGGSKIAVNKSAVISSELVAALITSGYSVIESYYDEFEPVADSLGDNRQSPVITFESLFQSFGRPTDLIAHRSGSIQKDGSKDFLGLLGVNAASSDEAAFVFLQHMQNISKIFEQARELVLVVSLDKIVKSLDDAVFQTKCMALFGLEALASGLRSKKKHESGIENLPFSIPPEQTTKKIHVILLDNGRSQILLSPYKELLACIDCRACNGACPAYLSDKPLIPSELPLKFRSDLLEITPYSLMAENDTEVRSPPAGIPLVNVETKDEIWDCTTCGNCNEVCPVDVKHLDTINALRGSMVMEKAIMPDTVSRALKSIEDRGHPWRGTTLTRTDWTHGLDIKTLAEDSNIDILYWVGCTEALESRSINIAGAISKLFKLSGVKAGILGAEESCCGEPARRLGNEHLFRMQAEKNIELLKQYSVKKIVTACPHCYNTIKNEYPDCGGKFEVIHHTQFITDLLNEGKLKIPGGENRLVTYHDPCYLGRYNGIYDMPRQILNNIPDTEVIEMKLSREQGFCCGGGGGHMWMEENHGRKIGEMRFEQAIDTGAEILLTACPFCLQMFDDATKVKGIDDSPKVMDIAELIAESIIARL
ncbi:heterodisulfide reductase-related iron-sulfur binding cluster [Chloroflexota bacterium]